MEITWQKLVQSNPDLRCRFESVSQWLNWLPDAYRRLQQASLPPVVAGELRAAMQIHGDSMLDLLIDETLEEVNRMREPRSGSEALTFVGIETRTPIDVHELLCKAIHEGDLTALATLAGEVTDIQLT